MVNTTCFSEVTSTKILKEENHNGGFFSQETPGKAKFLRLPFGNQAFGEHTLPMLVSGCDFCLMHDLIPKAQTHKLSHQLATFHTSK